jgi:thioredoxin reductase (NADPH)
MHILIKLLDFALNKIEYIFILMGAVFVWNQITKKNKREAFAKKALKKAIAANADEPLTLHPEINPALCAGCGACTRVCPEGDILGMIHHKAVLVSPTKCVGHGECEKACPFNAITLVFGTKTRGIDIPRLNSNYETNVPGLYIVGELGGMGLIRNAVKQGVMACEDAFKKLAPIAKMQYEVFIVGAGPAGLASALACVAHKKTYFCIEQNSFGGTVYNFPRQKIVMTAPAHLPLIGEMKFKGSKVTKEELLAYWNNIRKKAGIKIHEKTTFQNLEKIDGGFKIVTDNGEFTAQKVILGMGVRGSPRRLGLANEDLPKVTYNLIDPEQYQNSDILVVGGGNAGVEAAQYLAHPKYKNRVTLSVRGSDFDRCNDENKRLINEMAKKSLLQIWFQSSVDEIHADHLVVKHGEDRKTLPNQYLFIYAGAEMPQKFLMSLGIQIEKKFGEALTKSS